MGAESWSHFVPYQHNIADALEALRQREFAQGRYYLRGGHPPPQSIEEAVDQAGPEGTRSVIDVTSGVTPIPAPGCIFVLSRQQVIDLYGTDRPTREMIEENQAFFNHIDRGEAICIVAYDKAGRERELFFAGYSFD